MRNVGASQFTYDILKSAYDTDPRIKDIVKNFSQDVVELDDGSASDDLPDTDGDSSRDTVKKMAQRATDLGD